MICEDYSSRRRLREACYSLLTIVIGFTSCLIIAMLAYYTYQTSAGNIAYCSLWTDIPGRLAIFLIFYYAAGICGTLPIPGCFRVNWLPPPFILYRLESWRNLLENFCLVFTGNYRGYETLENDPEKSPLRDECNERDYDCSPTPAFQEESKNIEISETDTPKKRIVRSNGASRYRDMGSSDSYEDCSMSFDSPIPGQFVPMAKKKSSKPPYIPDSSISTSETTGKSSPDTLNDRLKAVAGLCVENDTPPRTPEAELSLPSFPRVPWSCLKNGSGVPLQVKPLHNRNLMTEKQEISEYKKRDKEGETTCSPKDSEHNRITNKFDPFANRQLYSPLIPAETETGFRARIITVPESLPNLGKMKTKIDKKTCSCSLPHRYRPYSATQISAETEDDSDSKKEDKYFGNPPGIQTKVDCIQKTPMEPDLSFQTGTSTSNQSIDFPSSTTNSNTGGNEASTFGQNTDIFYSEILNSHVDSETSISQQNTDVFSTEISDNNGDSSIEASTLNQDIDNFPIKISGGDETSSPSKNSDINSDIEV